MKCFFATLILGVTLPALAIAQAVEDTDGDGVYSMEELAQAFPSMTEDTFALMDTDADGAVDLDELAAAVEAGLLES